MASNREKAVLERFGMAIRARRLELDLSQEKLAEHAELHRTYIADIERGSRNIGLLNVVKLADALEIEISDLVRDLSLK